MHLSTLRPHVQRYRRQLAAVCAGLAVLISLSVLRAPASPSTAATPTLTEGEVATPVTLTSSAIAASFTRGDVIDLVGVPKVGAGSARVIARDARVLTAGGAGGFAASSSAIIVIATSETHALAIADASTAYDFIAWIRRDHTAPESSMSG